MVQSINTKVDYATSGTSFHGLTTYGKIMVGDKGFEFFNDKNIQDYIQIPWTEVDFLSASVLFKGKYIPRFMIRTKKDGAFSFASKEPKKVLKAINRYVASDHMLRSLSFFDVMKRKISVSK